MSEAAKLIEAAESAAEVRAHQTNPNVVALHVERIRGWVDRLIWSGMVLGLLFTMANVQHFASGGTKAPWMHGAWKDGSAIEWIVAWLLDPTVSLIVIGVLMGEQVINRHNIKAGDWVRVTKWVALGCTYAMNTWQAWSVLDPAKILLHSVPPAIVVCAAEAGPTLRRQITEAVEKAYRAAAGVSDTAPEGVSSTAVDTPLDTTRPVSDTVSKPVPDTMLDTPPDTAADTTRPVSNTPTDTVSNTPTDTVSNTATNTAPDTTASRSSAPRPRRKKAEPEPREVVARRIYDAYMAEHHEVISNAKLRQALAEKGHPTGNRTAADLLVEFKAHPLHIAS